jgi:hypothetical protein
VVLFDKGDAKVGDLVTVVIERATAATLFGARI